MEAFFKSSLVLTFAAPKNQLQQFIPPCLCLDTFQDNWAFIAVAMVQTTALRPKGFPAWMGNDFILAGFRIFVRYSTSNGKNLRGLYIIKSETDKSRMKVFGNLFTQYKYSKTDIEYTRKDNVITIESRLSNLRIVTQVAGTDARLPEHSPFADWKEARRFAGPLPHTFSYDVKKKEVLIIEGVRENWVPKPVEVLSCRIGFIDELQLNDLVLANAFIIENIPYYWKKGRTDLWRQQEENPSRA